ncbi:MAG: toll/interleukin-1 receptor domain-containing protein, partial [Rubrivivax sp.]|nr:toll/interleukin-1 receptor domain-containing protein [Rubrivivax sp.]
MSNVNLFISYRRSDTEHAAQRVRTALQAKFGDAAVFIDREMPPGVDWAEELARTIDTSTAVIVMIGDRFVELMDQASQASGDARDPLLVEIEAALAADKKIYPVVVGPRDMPPAARLPPSIAGLVRHNAVFAPPQYFDTAMEALTKAIAAQHGWVDPNASVPAAPGPGPRAGLSRGLGLALMALLAGLGIWAAGRVLVWLWGPAAEPAEAVFWHGIRFVLATSVLGLGPYLVYWVVAELRARAWLPIYNVQGIATAVNMAGVMVCGSIFLLLSTLPGWRL